MSSIINGYSTLAAVKGLLEVVSTNTPDDGVINDLITQTSRYIDDKTGRHFYPTIETRLFDVPEGRELWLDDDLLAATTVTNGDAVAVTEYNLLPPNYYPKYAVRIKDWSSVYWTTDSNSGSEQVISVLGVWGFHQKYATRAWALGSTVNENPLAIGDLTITVVSGALFSPGQIIKIENEIMNVTVVAGNDVTVAVRGDNGSTASAHVITTPVYIWQPEPDIVLACQMIVKNLYHNRFGQNTTGVATITGAGVVISPEDVPASALAILKNYERLC
jgi:hypothetical protein